MASSTSRSSSTRSFADETRFESIVHTLENMDQIIYHVIDRNESMPQTRVYLNARLLSIPTNPAQQRPASMPYSSSFTNTSPYSSQRSRPDISGASAQVNTDQGVQLAEKGALFTPLVAKPPSSVRGPPVPYTGLIPEQYTGKGKAPARRVAESSSSSSSEDEDAEGDVVMGGTTQSMKRGGVPQRGTPVASRRATRTPPSTRGRGRGGGGLLRGGTGSPRGRRRGG